MPHPEPVDPAKLALGEALFNDVRLSRDSNVSCASCHDLRTNGAMARRPAAPPNGQQPSLDTSTVFNAALSFRLNWEGNSRTLEDQAAMVLQRSDIMGGSVEVVLAKLQADRAMRQAFQAAYGRDPDRTSLFGAIATYERSLLTPDSRFDLWLGGDDAALSALELEGYRTFKSIGCVSCHQGVNVGGNLLQRHGVFQDFGSPAPEFVRVPSLRNVATTAPYFHDGSADTLEAAIPTMAAAQLGRDLLPGQVGQLVAFLGTLTGRYQGVPVVSPQAGSPQPARP